MIHNEELVKSNYQCEHYATQRLKKKNCAQSV